MHFVLFRDDLNSMKLRSVCVCEPNTCLSKNDFTVLNRFWQQLEFCTFKNTDLQMIFFFFKLEDIQKDIRKLNWKDFPRVTLQSHGPHPILPTG